MNAFCDCLSSFSTVASTLQAVSALDAVLMAKERCEVWMQHVLFLFFSRWTSGLIALFGCSVYLNTGFCAVGLLIQLSWLCTQRWSCWVRG